MKRVLITIAITTVLVQFLGSTFANNTGDCCKKVKSESRMSIRDFPFFSYI